MNRPPPGSYKYYLILDERGCCYSKSRKEFFIFAEDAARYASLEEAKQGILDDDLVGCHIREITVTERTIG